VKLTNSRKGQARQTGKSGTSTAYVSWQKHIKPAKVVYNGSVYKGGMYIR